MLSGPECCFLGNWIAKAPRERGVLRLQMPSEAPRIGVDYTQRCSAQSAVHLGSTNPFHVTVFAPLCCPRQLSFTSWSALAS